MIKGVLLRKAVFGVKVNCKSMAASCIRLALLLVILGIIVPREAAANSLSVGGGTLKWDISYNTNLGCGPYGVTASYYSFGNFSFTSSTGVKTTFSDTIYYYQSSGCASGVPQGAYPSSTLSLTGSNFIITFTPQSGGSGSATYTALTAQTITFSNPGAQNIGTPLTLSATASSGLTVSFASETTSICTVSGTTATFVAAGTCTIQATQAGNSTYAAATAVPQSFTVSAALQSQTISFSTPAAQTVGTPLTLSATASSGLVVSFASQTTSICTVSGTMATFVAAGTCTIQATQAGNSSYATATASQSFTVNSEAQTITFSNPGTQKVGTPLTLSATASSSLTVSLASQTSSICTVSGTTATFVAAGTCTIQATQAGNSMYAVATAVSQSFTVMQIQSITFSSPGAQTVGTSLILSATASSSLTVSFASQTTSICTVSGTTATFVADGTCTIQATQAGNSTYVAATAVSQSFAVRATASTSDKGNIPMLTNPSAPSTSVLTNSVITQTSTGQVGIGTVSPNSLLDISNYGTGVSVDPGDGETTFGILAFNQEAANSAVLSPAAYAYRFVHTGSATQGSDYLAVQVYNTAGSQITPQALVVNGTGSVGIGTISPSVPLEVNGSVKLTASSGGSITFQDGTTQSTAYTGVTCGGDYAESVDVTGNRTNYEPGDVLVIDPNTPGKFLKSVASYSTSVSGIYSTKPGTVGRRQTTAKSADEVPMAVVGIVPAKVSAENGPVKVGDLLVTSSTPGYAMKGTDRNRMLGAVVGKAMAKLDSGTAMIEVLVTLQ